MEEIIDIAIRVLATMLALLAGIAGKYLINWLKFKLNDEQDAKLDMFIAELVAAAEQMYKQEDPDGTIRMMYVQKMLVEAGYDITEAVQALIESKVYSINLFKAVPYNGGDGND